MSRHSKPGCSSNWSGSGESRYHRGSSGDSYKKGPSDNDNDDIKGSPGMICHWCRKFIKAHGPYWWNDWTDHWEVNLKKMSGKMDYPFYQQVICPDCAKAILELKKKRGKMVKKALEDKG